MSFENNTFQKPQPVSQLSHTTFWHRLIGLMHSSVISGVETCEKEGMDNVTYAT